MKTNFITFQGVLSKTKPNNLIMCKFHNFPRVYLHKPQPKSNTIHLKTLLVFAELVNPKTLIVSETLIVDLGPLRLQPWRPAIKRPEPQLLWMLNRVELRRLLLGPCSRRWSRKRCSTGKFSFARCRCHRTASLRWSGAGWRSTLLCTIRWR